MPRVLLINDHIRLNGGGDVVLHSEKEYLESCGYEVFLYGWGENAFEKDNIVVCKESLSSSARYLNKFGLAEKKRKHFRETLRRINPDIIHIHLVSKYPKAIYPELKGYRVIQTLHGPNLFCATSWGCKKRNSEPCSMGIGWKCYASKCVSFPVMVLYSLLDRNLDKYLRKNITIWHCPSRNIYNTAFYRGYERLVYIPLGIDERYTNNLEEEYHNNYQEKIIVFVGAISKVKGVDYLLDAFKQVKKDVPEAKLLFAGSGPYFSGLKKRVDTEITDGSVSLLGRVAHEEIENVYKRATVFAIPSIWQEQFGLVGPEALAMGIPVVGSNIGGIPEWLHHNEWGYLVTPRDTESLATRLSTLLKAPELSYMMGKRGREFVIKEYSYINYVQRIKQLIDSLYEDKVFRDAF